MGKYSYVNSASRIKHDELRKVENASLKKRRRRLEVEISHLLKELDRKIQEEKLLLLTLEVKRVKISNQNTEVKQMDMMMKKMEIGGS